MPYGLFRFAARHSQVSRPVAARPAAKPFCNVGSHRLHRRPQLVDVEQSIPGTMIDQSIDMINRSFGSVDDVEIPMRHDARSLCVENRASSCERDTCLFRASEHSSVAVPWSLGSQHLVELRAVWTFAPYGRSRRSDVRVVRTLAPFGRSRRLDVRAVRTLAPFGPSRRLDVRAAWTLAPFGPSRRSDLRAVRTFAPFERWRRSDPRAVWTFAPFPPVPPINSSPAQQPPEEYS